MSSNSNTGFQVTPWIHRIGSHIEKHPNFWQKLGNLESRFLDEKNKSTKNRKTHLRNWARSRWHHHTT